MKVINYTNLSSEFLEGLSGWMFDELNIWPSKIESVTFKEWEPADREREIIGPDLYVTTDDIGDLPDALETLITNLADKLMKMRSESILDLPRLLLDSFYENQDGLTKEWEAAAAPKQNNDDTELLYRSECNEQPSSQGSPE